MQPASKTKVKNAAAAIAQNSDLISKVKVTCDGSASKTYEKEVKSILTANGVDASKLEIATGATPDGPRKVTINIDLSGVDAKSKASTLQNALQTALK
jgi:hypothetical protein